MTERLDGTWSRLPLGRSGALCHRHIQVASNIAATVFGVGNLTPGFAAEGRGRAR